MTRDGSQRQSASVRDAFELAGRVAVITGAAGLLGGKHAEAIAEMGGTPILVDVDLAGATQHAAAIQRDFGVPALALDTDITSPDAVNSMCRGVVAKFGRIDILINNAARNPKVEDGGAGLARLETLSLAEWQADLGVGLTGAFLCAQSIGKVMATQRRGVILNIASDLAIIAPDQRLYRNEGVSADAQPVKPVTYSVVKSGLLGLTRYLATYWADLGVRCNALSPGGVLAGQDEVFLGRIGTLIPLGRMARADEYKAAIVFLVSDASSYMNGANVVIDGGRSVW